LDLKKKNTVRSSPTTARLGVTWRSGLRQRAGVKNTASCDGNTETGGDTIDTVNDVNDYGEGGERNEAVVMNNRRDLPEFFRRRKSHVALVASVKPDGDTKYRREGSSQD
jgi:hypothetical protein